MDAQQTSGEGKEGPTAQLHGQDSAQPHDLLHSSLTTDAEEKEGRAIIEQFICKCLKYQIKASPLVFIRKKKNIEFSCQCLCLDSIFFSTQEDKAHCQTTCLASWFSSRILAASRHRLGPQVRGGE